jgi:hypothetical protein
MDVLGKKSEQPLQIYEEKGGEHTLQAWSKYNIPNESHDLY